MFSPVPIPAASTALQHLINKYEKIDGESLAHQFVASEGTYKALEEITLAYPAAHPSEPLPNPNPLTPLAGPLTSGMHLSIVSIDGSVVPASVRTPSQGDSTNIDRLEDDEKDVQEDDDDSSNAEPTTQHSQPSSAFLSRLDSRRGSNGNTANTNTACDPFPSDTNSIFNNTYDPTIKRKRRIGTSANGTTSSFLSRVVVDPNLNARLFEHKSEDLFIFANVQRCLSWLDLGARPLVKHEPLSKLMLSMASIVCHDVNLTTKSSKGLDVIIGTSTGDIIWYDPMTTRYLRFNKQRCINPSAVTHIQWIPGSETLFMAAHADGSLIIYDKERDDVDFVASLATQATEGDSQAAPSNDDHAAISILKSAKEPRTKSNPVSYLALSRQAINFFAISPDQTHVAVACDDGCLKVVDYRQEKLLDVYCSYYGGLTCVAWSPDGHYMITGGKDDLITIWSFVERRIIARCYGHSSFITGLSFDFWRCDNFDYRFGSIGEDGRLCLWDFALASLHKPSSKAARSGALQMPEETNRPLISVGHDHRPSSTVVDGIAYHEVESRLSTAILSPIMVKQIDDQPPSHIVFLKDCIITGTMGRRSGRLKVWLRP